MTLHHTFVSLTKVVQASQRQAAQNPLLSQHFCVRLFLEGWKRVVIELDEEEEKKKNNNNRKLPERRWLFASCENMF